MVRNQPKGRDIITCQREAVFVQFFCELRLIGMVGHFQQKLFFQKSSFFSGDAVRMPGGGKLALRRLHGFKQFLFVGGFQDKGRYIIADGGFGVLKIRIAG